VCVGHVGWGRESGALNATITIRDRETAGWALCVAVVVSGCTDFDTCGTEGVVVCLRAFGCK